MDISFGVCNSRKIRYVIFEKRHPDLGLGRQLFGLSMGSWLPTLSILVSTNFGLASYGATIGMITMFQNIGVSIGPLMAGYIYDATGFYDLAFNIILILIVVAIFSILLVRRPKIH